MSEPMVCPECGSDKWQKGPSGGNSQNYRCVNLHYYNVNAFGMEKIIAPDMREPARKEKDE